MVGRRVKPILNHAEAENQCGHAALRPLSHHGRRITASVEPKDDWFVGIPHVSTCESHRVIPALPLGFVLLRRKPCALRRTYIRRAARAQPSQGGGSSLPRAGNGPLPAGTPPPSA